MSFSAAERAAAHRAGLSSAMNKRTQNRAINQVFDSGEASNFRSGLPTIAGALVTADRAYWVYLGRTARDLTVTKIRFHVTTVAVGTQAAEVAVASSDTGPDGAAKTLTVLGINATLDDLTTGTGMKGNTANMAVVVPQTTHVWAGLRVNMTSTPTQPVIHGLTFDNSNGEILVTSTAGVLATGSTYTGALIAAGVAWQCPALIASTW